MPHKPPAAGIVVVDSVVVVVVVAVVVVVVVVIVVVVVVVEVVDGLGGGTGTIFQVPSIAACVSSPVWASHKTTDMAAGTEKNFIVSPKPL